MSPISQLPSAALRELPAKGQGCPAMSRPLVGPLCMGCRHIRADWTCTAFPKGIPPVIYLDRGVDHTRPVKGDRGIQYEPRPPGEPEPDFEDVMLEELGELYEGLPPDNR